MTGNVEWNSFARDMTLLCLYEFSIVLYYISAVQPAARGPHAARRLMLCGPPVLVKFVRNMCKNQAKDKT